MIIFYTYNNLLLNAGFYEENMLYEMFFSNRFFMIFLLVIDIYILSSVQTQNENIHFVKVSRSKNYLIGISSIVY